MARKTSTMIGVCVLFCLLTLAGVAEAHPSKQATPTPTPTPTPRPAQARRTLLRNSTRLLNLNAVSDELPAPCADLSNNVSAWNVANAIPNGGTTDQFALNANINALHRVTEGYFPAICSYQVISGAEAVSPSGARIPALVWTYENGNSPYPPMAFSVGNGVLSNYYVAQLPVTAYSEPGNWQLSITAPEAYSITIRIPTPDSFFGLVDLEAGAYQVGGFQPNERVVGLMVASGTNELDILDDFEFVTNGRGYGSTSGHEPYIAGRAIYLVGDRGSGLIYANNTVLFPCQTADPCTNPNIPGVADGLDGQEMITYIRSLYWATTPTSGGSTTGTNCGTFAPRLTVGGQGQLVDTAQQVRIRNNANRTARQIGSITTQTAFTVLDGPRCNGGFAWWQVNYNNIIGWSAEAATGRYLLEPVASAPVQNSGLINEGEMFALSIDDVITTVEGDLWSFYGNSGDSVTVSLYSDAFDSYLELLDSNGNLLAQDDDSAGDLDSQINFVLPFSGTYQIKAHAYNNGASSGAYTLTLEIGSGSSGGSTNGGANSSDQVFMGDLYASTVSGSVSTAGGDVWQFDGSSGQSVTISMFSADGIMDCYLELYDDFGNLLMSNDDGAGNLDSRIAGFIIPQGGTYYIVAKTFGGSERSGYTLTFQTN